MALNFTKVCPRCKISSGNYHLMMMECDTCINEIAKENRKENSPHIIILKKK